jgi:hypothetical protein
MLTSIPKAGKSMSTIALTRDTFEDTVTKPGITLVASVTLKVARRLAGALAALTS